VHDEERRHVRRACDSIDSDRRARRGWRQADSARVGVRERRLHRHDRIQQGDEVRPRDRIDRRAGAALGGIEPRGRRRRQVAAGRCAEQADAIGTDAEFAARDRTVRIARSTSCSGAGWPYSDNRYFKAKTATPCGARCEPPLPPRLSIASRE
jgi:hypothetical protein